MRFRFLLSSQTRPSDADSKFLQFNPPPTGLADSELLAAELDDHVRVMGWRLVR